MNKKVALRGGAARVGPEEVLDAPKPGFRLPLAGWFRGELRDLTRDALFDPRTRDAASLAPEYVSGPRWTGTGRRAGPLAGDLDAAHVRAPASGVRRRDAAGAPGRSRRHSEPVSRQAELIRGWRSAGPARPRARPASARPSVRRRSPSPPSGAPPVPSAGVPRARARAGPAPRSARRRGLEG